MRRNIGSVVDWNDVRTPITRSAASQPEQRPIATFWTLVGPSGRPFTCAAFEVETGLELRANYDDGDVINTELFRGPDAMLRLEAKAEAWRQACVDKGFTDAAQRVSETHRLRARLR